MRAATGFSLFAKGGLGDSEQHDIGGQNGLEWSVDFIDRHNLDDFAAVVEGSSDDIVRSGFCKAVVKAMEVENERKDK